MISFNLYPNFLAKYFPSGMSFKFDRRHVPYHISCTSYYFLYLCHPRELDANIGLKYFLFYVR
jgi:hypothetical protein